MKSHDLLLKLKSNLFTYETPKMVLIESKFIGIMHRLTQVLILVVVIGWIFVINNGYQYIDTSGYGVFTTKLKGVSYSNSTDDRVGRRIWDAADVNVPAQQSNSFFMMTNAIITNDQQLSTCPDMGEWSAQCEDDSDCMKGEPLHLGHGVATGECNKTVGYCVVFAWCDTEDDELPENGTVAVLKHTEDFTVFIKNHVYFPYFKKGRSNLVESVTKAKLRNGCTYHPTEDPFCPIFRIGTIVGMAARGADTPDTEADNEIFKEIAIEGGVVSINVIWDCDFDLPDAECIPKYEFTRLDDLQSHAASPGHNFRFPVYYLDNGIQKRQLVKAFGVYFALNTDAQARKFGPSTFLLNIGSGLALLSVASIASDILLLKIHKNREYFKKHKMEPTVTIAQRKNEMESEREHRDTDSTAV